MCALLCLCSAGCYDWALVSTDYLLRREPPAPASLDAIVVPGCPALPDGGVSTCIARRVGVAVAAWREGLAPRILMSGAAVRSSPVEARVMARYAHRLGVPGSAILVEPKARHTEQNIRYAAQMLLAQGLRRVLVVTDPFQLPIAVRLSHYAGLEAWAQPTVPPLPAALLRQRLPLDDMEPLVPLSWY